MNGMISVKTNTQLKVKKCKNIFPPRKVCLPKYFPKMTVQFPQAAQIEQLAKIGAFVGIFREAYNLINVDNMKDYSSVFQMLHLKNSVGFYQNFQKGKEEV